MKFLSILTAITVISGNTIFAQDQPGTAGLAVKNNESIAFLGDSITQFGADLPGGYVRLVISGLQANGVTAVPIPAGVSGNKSNQMLERLDAAVLSKKPDWLFLSCGVNDVMHGANGIPLDQYKPNITAIVDKARAAGIKVMILTPTMIQEDPANAQNVMLAGYNEFLRRLAKEKGCLLADLNAEMQAALKPEMKGKNQLTRDGVHMNPFGDQMMAVGVLKGLGMDERQVQKARDFWISMPEVACTVTGKTGLTLRQYKELSDLAAKDNRSVEDLVNAELAKSIESVVPASSGGKSK